MSDLAAVFHWSPAEMAEMELGDLMDWRERAIARLPTAPEE